MADDPAPTLPPSAALPVIIDPAAAVTHRGWREAWDAVLRAVEVGPRLIFIVGAPGSGKSLLLRALASQMRDGFDVLLLARGDMPLAGAEAAPDGRRRVVLIDQAQRLNETALGGLARLGDCTVVLTGLADQNVGSRLSDAVATVVTLPPVGDDEVGDFVAARLARAGLPAELFGGAGLAALAARAGGQARRLNMLASAALGVAREHGVSSVGRLEVEQAARLLDQPAREPFVMPASPPEAPSEAPPGTAFSFGGPPAAGAVASSPDGAAVMAATNRRSGLLIGALTAAFAVAMVGGWLARRHAPAAARPAPAAMLTLLAPPVALPAPPAGPPPALLTPPPLDLPSSPAAAPARLAEAPVDVRSTPQAIAVPPPPQAVAVLTPPHSDETMAPPAAEISALSVAAPARLVLMFGRGDAAATARASSLAMVLTARGFAVELRPVRSVNGATASVRYFFAEDRDAADAVLAAAGLPGRTLQAALGAAEPMPRPGLIELVLPAGSAPAVGEVRTRLVQTTNEGRVP